MLERQVEEGGLADADLPVEALGDGGGGDAQGFSVGSVGERGVAVDVAGELVEEENERESGVGRGEGPGVEGRGGASGGDERGKEGGGFRVEGGGGGEPACVGVGGVEPEGEDAVDVFIVVATVPAAVCGVCGHVRSSARSEGDVRVQRVKGPGRIGKQGLEGSEGSEMPVD